MRLERSSISVAPIEYVILRKLEYHRASGSERHLRDVAMMLRISGNMIDAEAFGQWIGRLDLRTSLAEAREYQPRDGG